MPSPFLTTVRDLHRRRGRERRGRTLAEGVRLVEEAAAWPKKIEGALHSPLLEKSERGRALLALLSDSGVALHRVSDDELETLADTRQPQGIIAVVEQPRWSLGDIALGRGAVLVLDAVQDPGNAGTMMRTAFGLGGSGVIALPGTVEPANPKVVRASMGAYFRLPWVSLDAGEFLAWAREHAVVILRAEMSGEPVAELRVGPPVALVVGNEGAGLSAALNGAGRAVAVPLAPGAESLNVAIAAAILLYEVQRER